MTSIRAEARMNASQMIGQLKKINTNLMMVNTQLMRVDDNSRRAATGMRRTTTAGKKSTSSFKQLGSQLKGTMLSYIGLNAIIGIGVQQLRKGIQWVQESIQQYRKFEKAIAEVGTILGETASENIPMVTAKIERLSITFGKSANDLTEGMYDIVSAAFSAEDGLTLLKTATEAAIAGLADVSTSVDVFTSILNAWGLSVWQASDISDQLFQTIKRGKLRFEDLASAMGYIAPIAANLGVEFKEVSAALSTVTRQGQHVDMATRGLALGLQNMADLTPKAAKAARKYGVDLSATALRVGGLEYIIKQLNTAMEEHGTKILPEMISNMRSLRVFMALAGEEGVKGFTRDLEELENASGRTTEAMNKMMQTQQFQADVLGQQMKMLERDIGEAWSGFDILWKKTKLWFGTLISGGDANKAIEQFNSRMREVRSQAAEVIKAQYEMSTAPSFANILGDIDISQFDNFEQAVSGIADIVSEKGKTLFTGVKQWLDLKSQTEDLALFTSGLLEFETVLQGALSDFASGSKEVDEIQSEIRDALIRAIHPENMTEGGREAASSYLKGLGDAFSQKYIVGKSFDIDKMIKADPSLLGFLDTLGVQFKSFGEGFKEGMEDLAKVDTRLAQSPAGFVYGFYRGLKNDVEELDEELQVSIIAKRLEEIQSASDKFTDKITNLVAKQETYESSVNTLNATMDNLQTSINESKMNIIELEKAIKELTYDVEDTYTTMAKLNDGFISFKGVDEWKLAVMGAETQIDRFTHYAQRAIKYNLDMNMSFMDGIDGIEGMEKIMKDLPDYLTETNESIWKTVKANQGLSESLTLEDLIHQIRDYTSEQKDLEEQTEETRKEMDALNLVLKKNNLEISKIELKGMMRRRGLTRQEERVIKKIKIKNAEIRIKMTEKELSEEQKIIEENTEFTKDKLSELEEAYNMYVDEIGHQIWELKDTRNSDLLDMIENINYKKDLLTSYRIMMQTEYDKMTEATLKLTGLLTAMGENEELAKAYEAAFGIDALKQAQKEAEAYVDFLKQHNMSIGDNEIELPVEPPEKKGETGTPRETETSSKPFKIINKEPEIIRTIDPITGKKQTIVTGKWKFHSSSGKIKIGNFGDYDFGDLIEWKRGTQYIPETRPYLLHEGETVLPRGAKNEFSNSGGNTINITVNARVENDYDVEKLAARLGYALDAQLMNKKGKSRFRMR